ncbi:hypothetical protein A3A95_02125 [Candidatus Nomurabacteria bacterium RIFCSPLOWO2_01_FULL_39_18]|uniref:Uncharacterized protein n=1 Tax=Candidatus Nomurabacteria bacterium RIFCSPHIGHO2_01_FULL_40_24b TaxID=1801739 RepID=A0A1F6V9D7_9BACT|nr:MAG: hypothetical protein A2647_00590 [Candidatus Nomurabacteria bacterium RIFCSPHIGHO2_01_FULL_40_24b]OGI90661.1 MAG: hypothetical protein A3A95_02125 [Candidatus Nomurabacteria bacterium RIFCSPLOWO2_01_FULL_39_18]
MYPELIDYIKKAKQQGVSDEQIKQNLLSSGWSPEDIKTATEAGQNPIPISPASPGVSDHTIQSQPKHTLLKIILPVILLVALATGGYIFYAKQKTGIPLMPSAELVINEGVSQASSQTSTSSNPDIEKVKIILEDIRQGYLTENTALIVKHSSAETAAFFSSAKMAESTSSFTINSVSQSDLDIVANITVVSGGKIDTQNMVFIKEGDTWKLDLAASIKWEMDQEEKRKQSIVDDKNGYVDLATDIKVVPTNPNINNGNAEIIFTVTNQGTKAVIDQAMEEQIFSGPNKKYLISAGSYPITIAPGEVWEHKFYWEDIQCDKFSSFCFQKGGNVEFYYSMNLDKRVKETNYTNNQTLKNIYFVK